MVLKFILLGSQLFRCPIKSRNTTGVCIMAAVLPSLLTSTLSSALLARSPEKESESLAYVNHFLSIAPDLLAFVRELARLAKGKLQRRLLTDKWF